MEPAPPVRPILTVLLGLGFGTYLVFTALAVADVAPWGFALLPPALACLVVMVLPARPLLRRR